MVGLFSPMARVRAGEVCWDKNGVALSLDTYGSKKVCEDFGLHWGPTALVIPITTTEQCWDKNNGAPLTNYTTRQVCEDSGEHWGTSPPATPATPTAPADKSAFQTAVDEKACLYWFGLSPGGCLVQFMYYLLYVVPAFLLGVVAYFFNILISITLSSTMFKSVFISNAWAVVRDLSNIFFILILLYIAIQIILGLGGTNVKKMITKVIIIALLINFSMFFTEVVIDSSNILALIFYNKISTGKKDPVTGNIATAPYDSVTGEKDISGGLVSAFNPTSLLTKDFFDQAKITLVPGHAPIIEKEVPLGMMVGIILVTGLILLFAAYALFVAGLCFVGRLIELFILIIFSPFAFMSSTIPILGKVDYIGWDAWFKRLLTVAFMAPIFMFFLYFIFMLTNAGIFNDSLKSGSGIIIALLRIAIPAMVILILLLKAVEFAKKGSGVLGEKLMAGAKMVGGLALGAATGGAALGLSGLVGGGGGYLAKKAATGMNKLGATTWGRRLGANKLASGLQGAGAYLQKSSFDIRGIKGVQSLAGAAGIKLGEAQKGGIEQRRKDKVEKRMRRADELKVGEDEGLKQKLNKSEIDLQTMLGKVAKDFGNIDRELESLRKAKADTATGSDEEKEIADKMKVLNNVKKEVKEGRSGAYTIDGVTRTIAPVTVVNAGKTRTMKEMASQVIPEQKEDIITENRRRTTSYANRATRLWGGLRRANREARHKIIMESKLPESAAKA